MKKQTLILAFLTALTLFSCKNNQNKNLLNDAQKAAELACSAKGFIQKARTGDLSALDEETRVSEELALLKKKYKDNEEQNLEFLEAFNKAMLNCGVKEVSIGEDIKAVETVSEGISANEDFDKMLDDFDTYVDDYVKLYKKSLTGDMDAISEYPALLEKAESLQQSIEKAQQNKQLTSAQIKRLTAIQTKMAKGLQ